MRSLFPSREGGALLDEFREERKFEELEEEARRSAGNEKKKTAAERAAVERARGLAWLALVTALAVWTSGVVGGGSEFFFGGTQP